MPIARCAAASPVSLLPGNRLVRRRDVTYTLGEYSLVTHETENDDRPHVEVHFPGKALTSSATRATQQPEDAEPTPAHSPAPRYSSATTTLSGDPSTSGGALDEEAFPDTYVEIEESEMQEPAAQQSSRGRIRAACSSTSTTSSPMATRKMSTGSSSFSEIASRPRKKRFYAQARSSTT